MFSGFILISVISLQYINHVYLLIMYKMHEFLMLLSTILTKVNTLAKEIML